MYRNQKLLETVREFECALCGAEDGTVVAAHSNQLRDGKGKGIKAHDHRIAALCFRFHMAIDQGHRINKQEKEAMWEEAHRKTIGFLFERGKIWVQ